MQARERLMLGVDEAVTVSGVAVVMVGVGAVVRVGVDPAPVLMPVTVQRGVVERGVHRLILGSECGFKACEPANSVQVRPGPVGDPAVEEHLGAGSRFTTTTVSI